MNKTRVSCIKCGSYDQMLAVVKDLGTFGYCKKKNKKKKNLKKPGNAHLRHQMICYMEPSRKPLLESECKS